MKMLFLLRKPAADGVQPRPMQGAPTLSCYGSVLKDAMHRVRCSDGGLDVCLDRIAHPTLAVNSSIRYPYEMMIVYETIGMICDLISSAYYMSRPIEYGVVTVVDKTPMKLHSLPN